MSYSADPGLSEAALTGAARSSARWRSLVEGRGAVLALWLGWSLLWLAVLFLSGTAQVTPDDYMRLLEVRDLLGGQSWYDVTQYRMAPPDGASMHWSRLVDLPLAGAILAFSAILPPAQAELAAMALVPLLYLLPAMLALSSIMRSLGLSGGTVLAGLALLPLFPLLPASFAPMAIDHHVPQALILLVCAALLLKVPSRGASVLSGVLAAACVAISLESLPLVAVLAAIYGLNYALSGERALQWFLGALAVAAPVFSLATRPLSAFSQGYCDILLPGHMAAFALAALIAGALPFTPGKASVTGRFAGLALLPAGCLPLAVATLGPCAVNPMAELDPVVTRYWHALVLEGLPVWKQNASVAAMLLWTTAIALAGLWLAHARGLTRGENGPAWLLFALLALAANLYALLVMRAALGAQLLTVPFAALLVAHFWPRAREIGPMVPRLAATLACLTLGTPVLASALFKPFDVQPGSAGTAEGRPAQSCDLSSLASLPKGLVLASLDTSPEILARTSHSVVAGPYHRNQAPMLAVIETLTGEPREAGSIARQTGADYLAVCMYSGETAILRERRRDNLLNRLAEGKVPDWLEPVPGFDRGALRVYRVAR